MWQKENKSQKVIAKGSSFIHAALLNEQINSAMEIKWLSNSCDTNINHQWWHIPYYLVVLLHLLHPLVTYLVVFGLLSFLILHWVNRYILKLFSLVEWFWYLVWMIYPQQWSGYYALYEIMSTVSLTHMANVADTSSYQILAILFVMWEGVLPCCLDRLLSLRLEQFSMAGVAKEFIQL